MGGGGGRGGPWWGGGVVVRVWRLWVGGLISLVVLRRLVEVGDRLIREWSGEVEWEDRT